MRAFTLGSGPDRKFVMIEVDGDSVIVTESQSAGGTKTSEKALKSEPQARSACERMAAALIARGFVEQTAPGPAKTRPIATAPKLAASSPAARASEPESGVNSLFEDDEEPVGSVLPRVAAFPDAGPSGDAAPKKKKKKSGGKKAKKGAENDDGLDRRVIAAVVATGVVFLAFLGFMAYDTFLKPATIVGAWKGSRLAYETGGPIIYTQYGLVLDDQKRASLTLQEEFTSVGTYTVRGDRLKLALKDEDGESTDLEYRIALAGATLDLFEPTTGKKAVQLVRLPSAPKIGGGAPPPATPKGPAAGAGGKVDAADDARLASVAFSPKDGAFKLRHPPGWTAETGGRADNSYSWAKFTKGSAKVKVAADLQGSLMSGSDFARDHEEGSETAPVHTAHTLYRKTASSEYSDYQEGEPALFKGSRLGEGRISAFTASGGGLFGSKLRGYRVTLLTGDRRVTILCDCSAAEFEELGPTFLAVCRSLSR